MSDFPDPIPPGDADEIPPRGALSARVPESIGNGVFSNGVLILAAQYEWVLDFALRMGEVQRIVARVVLPPPVVPQLVEVLKTNLRDYERRFGAAPRCPRPVDAGVSGDGGGDTVVEGEAVENVPPGPEGPVPIHSPQIDDIYDELKLPDEVLAGRYANSVLVRHSNTEFSFVFINRIFPRAVVTAHVYMAAGQVPPFLESLARSAEAHFRRRPPPPEESPDDE